MRDITALLVIAALLVGVVGICHISNCEKSQLNERISVLEEQRNFSEKIYEAELLTSRLEGWSKGVNDTIGIVASERPTRNHTFIGSWSDPCFKINLAHLDDSNELYVSGELYSWE